MKKKIALILSGGSAYGFAHIGVLKVLEKNNIKVDIVGGTSMGAIVGGCYSAGMSVKKMEETLVGFSRRKIMDINPFVLTDDGLLFGKKVTSFLNKLLENKQIEDCNPKFFCIAADLEKGKKVVFNKGNMVDAIRASMSVPGVFKPIKKDGMCLVDGGICDNLPVADARKMGANVVIAVDVCSHYKKENKLKSAFDIIISACNLTLSNWIKSTNDKGDVYIKIDQPDVAFLKFSYEDAIKSIKNGEKMAKKMLPKILEAINDCEQNTEQNISKSN